MDFLTNLLLYIFPSIQKEYTFVKKEREGNIPFEINRNKSTIFAIARVIVGGVWSERKRESVFEIKKLYFFNNFMNSKSVEWFTLHTMLLQVIGQ